jgi:hypothetical protein
VADRGGFRWGHPCRQRPRIPGSSAVRAVGRTNLVAGECSWAGTAWSRWSGVEVLAYRGGQVAALCVEPLRARHQADPGPLSRQARELMSCPTMSRSWLLTAGGEAVTSRGRLTPGVAWPPGARSTHQASRATHATGGGRVRTESPRLTRLSRRPVTRACGLVTAGLSTPSCSRNSASTRALAVWRRIEAKDDPSLSARRRPDARSRLHPSRS